MHAGAWQVYALVQRDAAVFDQHHAIGQGHGLLHVVRDEQRGEAMGTPQAFDQPVHLDARERVERAQGLVEQQQARLVHQRPRQGHALALAARQARGPFALALAQAHLGQHRSGAPQAGRAASPGPRCPARASRAADAPPGT
jgi:hypothetical protein